MKNKLLLSLLLLQILVIHIRGQILRCHQLEYWTGLSCCPMCPVGAGLKIKTTCTTRLNTVCEPKEGFFCLEPLRGGCTAAQRHKSCKPGQCISKKGTALTDTECSDCSEGEYSNGTFTSCLPHTKCESKGLQLINPGTESTDAECGGQSSTSTAVIVGTVVPVFIVTVGAVSVTVWRLRRKKDGCEKPANHSNGMNSKPKMEHQDGEEISEMISET